MTLFQRHGRLILAAGILPLLTLTSLLMLSSAKTGSGPRSPLVAQAAPGSSSAASSQGQAGGVTLLFRPHCEQATPWACPSYATLDPQTLTTPAMKVGDTLDLDIVARNPANATVQHILAWLAYDPNILTGKSVTPGAAFPLAAPGGQDFDPLKGLVMIDVETQKKEGVKDGTLVVARVAFTVKAVPPGGKAVVAFHDPGGTPPHTAVFTAAPSSNILGKPVGALSVIIAASQGTASVASSSASTSLIASIASSASSAPPASSASSSAPQNLSSASSESPLASSASSQINSSIASSAASVAVVSSASSEGDAIGTADSSASSTGENMHPAAPFGEIQPQNVRVTTDRSTLYVSWDAIPAPDLRGYHVYYGTQTGRYIQRRTVRPDQTGISIHSLVEATRYYVAVRGFNEQGEETAFSKEAAVVIGNPGTSTSPLSGDVIGSMNGGNPVSGSRDVPGNAGTGEMVILVLASAIIGTVFAVRRQGLASSRPLHG